MAPGNTMRETIVALLSFGVAVGYHQFRDLKCSTPSNTIRGGKERAQCHLVLKDEETEKGRDVPNGLGCFTEKGPKGEEREYCDIVCPNSHTVFNAYIDQGHRACFNFYTYQLEKRGQEWFMWRSGKCLNSTANFRIGCKFDDPFNSQFKDDNAVHEHLKLKRKKKIL